MLLGPEHAPWLTPAHINTAPAILSALGGMSGFAHPSSKAARTWNLKGVDLPMVAFLGVKDTYTGSRGQCREGLAMPTPPLPQWN